MAIQRLTAEEFQLLEEIETGKKSKPTDSALVDRLKEVCQRYTEKYNQEKRSKSDNFTVSTPITLPTKDALGNMSKTSFVGMETMNFQRFLPTAKGEIVVALNTSEMKNHDIYVRLSQFPDIFGPSCDSFLTWVKPIMKERREIMLRLEAQSEKIMESYKDVKSYGSW